MRRAVSAAIQSGFEEAYRSGTPPWDIGRPQPEVVRLAKEGRIVGDVLDVGCGTGENALHLASLGRRVVGLDGSSTAIASARAKAAERGLMATFVVGDALELPRLQLSFDTAIDCGLFHVFPDEERPRYAQSLWQVLAPGGTLHVLCFSDAEPPGWGPRRIAEGELLSAFRDGFFIAGLRAARFANHRSDEGARAWLASFTRL
jgi:SAM-dependent methyltransferase